MKKTLTFLMFVIFALTSFSATNVIFNMTEKEIKVSANETFEVLAKFSIADGWHIYGEKTEIGMPTKITPILPKGFSLESIEFPPTKKFTFMSISSDGYTGDILVKIKIKAPEKNFDSPQQIEIKASWLSCSDTCVPEEKIEFINVIDSLQKSNKTLFNPLLIAIMGAMLGGFILNVMPCVFPVISLKIMSFASSSNSSKLSIVINGAIFSIGIIASFAVLSVVLASLKAVGSSVGWGFQLQNPTFTLLMACVFWLISLNFIGLWEFGSSISSTAMNAQASSSNKYLSSFFSGILAVLVASPCVAPFMASAVGFALAGEASAFESILVITSVGIGMALPYILLTIFPSLVKKLPKPGKWLDNLKKILSIPMLLTVIWLVLVFRQQGGDIFKIAISFTLLAISAYVWGKYANILNKKSTRITAVIVSICIAIVAFFTAKISSEPPIHVGSEQAKNLWSTKKVDELLKSGKIVFVDFTASWCLTCQYNKQIINSEKIKKLFADNNIVVISADWTNRNTEIGDELKKYGRAGVPLYLLFSPKTPQKPEILPSILTQSIIVEAVDKIKQ